MARALQPTLVLVLGSSRPEQPKPHRRAQRLRALPGNLLRPRAGRSGSSRSPARGTAGKYRRTGISKLASWRAWTRAPRRSPSRCVLSRRADAAMNLPDLGVTRTVVGAASLAGQIAYLPVAGVEKVMHEYVLHDSALVVQNHHCWVPEIPHSTDAVRGAGTAKSTRRRCPGRSTSWRCGSRTAA